MAASQPIAPMATTTPIAERTQSDKNHGETETVRDRQNLAHSVNPTAAMRTTVTTNAALEAAAIAPARQTTAPGTHTARWRFALAVRSERIANPNNVGRTRFTKAPAFA